MDTGARSTRNDLFQELKPKCIELSQLALRDDGSTSNLKALIESTGRLLHILEQKCQRTDGVFDAKLADYVFFPLSQVLRRKQKYTDRLSELTIKCLQVLLEYGWRETIASDLAKQLLILLTFVAGGVPGKESTAVPEELSTVAYACLAALFRDLQNTPGGYLVLVRSETIPAVGHSVTVILEGLTDGPSAAVQLQALLALDRLWHCVKDQEALSNFLPGTVSALTKSLMPSTGTRRSRKFLVESLSLLSHVLTSVLSDIRTRTIRGGFTTDRAGKTLTPSWLKATATQIKLALSNIMRLRNHESVDVRKSLNRLCITILDECHDTLAESSSMLVETCMTLTGIDSEDDLSNRATSIVDLASIHANLCDLIKDTVYNWVTSLPRVMQANDETAKNAALHQLSKAHELLEGLQIESSTLEEALASSLRDTIAVTLEPNPSSKSLQETDFDWNSQAAMTLATDNTHSVDFKWVLLPRESQKETRKRLLALVGSLGSRESQIKKSSEMLDYARGASGPGLLSSYWLSFQILKSSSSQNKDLDEFFDSSLTLSDEQEIVSKELLSYSLSLLTNSNEEEPDWRIQAIALEVVADTAQRAGENFRVELVDTLYPVSQLLGSSNSRLREHAVTCLNIISRSCGYRSTSEMIVDNVDYMVNAISLRLDTFDISPQAPQVLVMMIRLTGPTLLLYLDDVVGSIFAALENFHGYQLLVDSMFSVLVEIVTIGSKSKQLQIADGSTSVVHRKVSPPPPSIADIVKLITPKPLSEPDTPPKEEFPKKPWKSAQTLLDEAEDEPGEEDEEPSRNTEIEKPPATKTYKMLQSIARLSQHYLTSSSPVLRSKLLGLIATSSTALHNDEDEFLPLVNDFWPVVIKRLYDDEPFVQIAACDAVAEICRSVGDFMSTRISTEWGDLMKLAKSSKEKFRAEKKGKGGRGIYSQNSQLWEAVVRLLTTVVGYVRIDDVMFDEVLGVLGELAWERDEVREAMEVVNADAVWFAMLVAGKVKLPKILEVDNHQFARWDVGISAR